MEQDFISTPARVRWREFRIRWVPGICFVAAVAAVVVLWSGHASSSTLTGVGEGIRALVASPQPGMLRSVLVEPFQAVTQGDVIAVVVPTDPRQPLSLLQTHLDLTQLRLQPTLAQENVMNFERIRVELLRTKSELEIAKVRLELAEGDVARNEPLFREKLVSEEIYELSKKTRDMYRAEVLVKSNAVAEIEARLTALRTLGDPTLASTNSATSALLAQLEHAFEAASTNLGPITLRAPISGVVSAIQRQEGEHVLEGEPLVSIQSQWARHVIGYLRQPYPIDPEVGQPVEVTTRTARRRSFRSHIIHVGAQIEAITNSLAFLRQGALVDSGLPIVVEIPDGIGIRPGEMVDLYLHSEEPSEGPFPFSARLGAKH